MGDNMGNERSQVCGLHCWECREAICLKEAAKQPVPDRELLPARVPRPIQEGVCVVCGSKGMGYGVCYQCHKKQECVKAPDLTEEERILDEWATSPFPPGNYTTLVQQHNAGLRQLVEMARAPLKERVKELESHHAAGVRAHEELGRRSAERIADLEAQLAAAKQAMKSTDPG